MPNVRKITHVRQNRNNTAYVFHWLLEQQGRMVAVSDSRLKQMNAALNAGYNMKVAALADRPETRSILESAASRGNPFAVSSKSLPTKSLAKTSSSRNDHDRLQQIDTAMNKGYMEHLANVSPTRMQAAIRGNPFAIFETNSWKSCSDHEQRLNLDVGWNSGAAESATLADRTDLRADAAAKGNPFAQFGFSHWHDQSSLKTLRNSGSESLAGGASGDAAAVATGKQRLEASVVHAKSRNRVAAVTASKLSISKPRQHNTVKPMIHTASDAICAKTFETPAVFSGSSPSGTAAPSAEGEAAGSLLFKRRPRHSALRLSLPTTPSERNQSPALNVAEKPSPEMLRGPCEGQPPSAAATAPAVAINDRTVINASSLADGCAIKLAASITDSPAHARTDTTPSFNREQHGAACDGERSEINATLVEHVSASDLNFGDLSATVQSLELEIRSLREQMFGNEAGSGEQREENTLCDSATHIDVSAPADQSGRSLLRRSFEYQPASDRAINNSDFMSPRTLFAEPSNDTKVPLQFQPDEQPLADLLLHSMKLPQEVAALVANCMKETVKQNAADRANFRAEYSAKRESAGCYSASCTPPGQFSSVSQMLDTAERAVRLRAAKEAEEEEEKFHQKVVARLVKKNAFFW